MIVESSNMLLRNSFGCNCEVVRVSMSEKGCHVVHQQEKDNQGLNE